MDDMEKWNLEKLQNKGVYQVTLEYPKVNGRDDVTLDFICTGQLVREVTTRFFQKPSPWTMNNEDSKIISEKLAYPIKPTSRDYFDVLHLFYFIQHNNSII